MHLSILLTFLFSSLSMICSAHFILNYPGTIGFNDKNEGQAPCGGFTVSFSKTSNITNYHVGGDTIALVSIHPVADWIFRATLDKTAAGGWVDLRPVIAQSGLGAFCETGVMVPSGWAGQQGVIQVVQHAIDGILYQCAAVNYVSGLAKTIPHVCHNVSGLTASYTKDAALSHLPTTFAAKPTSTTGSTSGNANSAGHMQFPEALVRGLGAVACLVGALVLL